MDQYRLEEPFEVVLHDGPDDATTMIVAEIRPFADDRVVMSRHGEGYYRLNSEVDPVSGMVLARWTPHSDARFPWRVPLLLG